MPKTQLKLRRAIQLLTLIFIAVTTSTEPADANSNQEIGFIERFALAEDRQKILEELIPGTNDYYYFNCLYLEQTQDWEKQSTLLQEWDALDTDHRRRDEIKYRRALLRYGADPDGSLKFIREKLDLRFNHQQDKRGQKPNLPTQLDQKVIAHTAFLDEALRKSIDHLGERGLDFVMRNQKQLNKPQTREVLRRLQWPDYKNLVEMIAADLNLRESRGFGEFAIHSRLTEAQLIELAKKHPKVTRDADYIRERILRMQPNNDINWRYDLAEKEAYLERVREYVATLDSAQNSLKAHVKYHLLDLKRQRGVYDRKLFLTYLHLPRNVDYIEPEYLNLPRHRGQAANLGQSYEALTGLPPIDNDHDLVWDHLSEFLRQDGKPDAFRETVREERLDHLWAEVMLQSGKGEAERFYSILGPSKTQALKERVTINLRPSNPKTIGIEDDLALTVDVKNVPQLLIKVYELNALNYYLKEQREIDTAIDLDGLIPNLQRKLDLTETPMLSKRRTFDFPELKGRRGTWVIEFIGGGKSSRALIRKGSLQLLSRTTAAGAWVQVLDDANQLLNTSAFWLGGRRYASDKEGTIILPFSTSPGRKTVILEANGIASLATLDHQNENYELTANFYLDREQLLARNKATLIVKSALTASGVPAPIGLLEEVELTIVTRTIDGVTNTDRVAGFELFADQESVHEFTVPDRLASITMMLAAKVDQLSEGGRKVSLDAGDEFWISMINSTQQTRALFLTRFDEHWIAELLGKNGEAIAETPLNLRFTHQDFPGFERHTTLKTDVEGRANLGALAEISQIRIASNGVQEQLWNLPREMRTREPYQTAKAGDTVLIPYTGNSAKPVREEIAVFAVRNNALREDLFDKVRLEDRNYVLEGFTPGDYRIFLRSEERAIHLSIGAGNESDGYVLGRDRHLELASLEPASLQSAKPEGEDLVVTLSNVNPLTRVHVIAGRFLPEFNLYAAFENFPRPALGAISRGKALNSFVSGRTLGEEYRYIIERRQAKHHPGNLLGRPGLLLNPWALRDSKTDTQTAASGDLYDQEMESEPGSRKSRVARRPAAPADSRSHPDLGFLATSSSVLANVAVEDNGEVRIPLKAFGDRNWIRIIVADPSQVIQKDVFLPDGKTAFQDLRLAASLDPNSAFAQTKQTSLLEKGDVLELGSTEFKIFDNFGDLHRFFNTIGNAEQHLGEFSFILDWPNLPDEVKREKYSKYACHELSFFLSRRDPDFFTSVIKPYLSNKRDRTFLDNYLLGENLDSYLQLYEFNRLNITEKLILARRLGGDSGARINRHVLDNFALLPPNPSQDDHLFETALRSRSSGEGEEEMEEVLAELSDGLVAAELSPPAPAAVALSGGIDLQGSASKFKMSAPKKGKKQAKTESLNNSSFFGGGGRALGLDAERAKSLRQATRQLYRKLDATKVWAENNYHEIPIERQIANFITVNAFWRDYASWDGKGEFKSANFIHATTNFSEMMFALSLIGLPQEGSQHQLNVEDGVLKVTAGGNAIIFHQEIVATEIDEDPAPLLVSQNFFDPANRYREENGQRLDLFVTDEFLAGKAYGCQIVVTNPTSSRQFFDLMTQIPALSLPLEAARVTHSRNVAVEPFSTQKFDYFFYFPTADGQHSHYPVQLIKNSKQLTAADPFTFNVVDELTKIDTTSWDYISQWGTSEQVIEFLKTNNLGRIKLSRIGWRVREDLAFFEDVHELLSERGRYDQVLMSYGVFHNQPKAIRELLLQQKSYLNRCGLAIESDLVDSDPIQRHRYQHLEYAPLVNARAHQLGAKRKILNPDLLAQYRQFLTTTSYDGTLDSEQHLAAAYYLLLQDRIDEGLAHFTKVEAEQIRETVQSDYLTCYAEFYRGNTNAAREIATRYVDFKVEKWREKFANVLSQLNEIDGALAEVHDDQDREQQQDQLANTESTFDLNVENREIEINYRNLKSVTLNFYEMDLEFLFSSDPFVSSEGGRFSMIRPNSTQTVELAEDKTEHKLALPEEYHSSNILIEVVGSGRKKSQAYYSNSLDVSVVEDYGRLQVFDASKAGKKTPLSASYVKVYAQFPGKKTQFYKDGYTDLRGKFDYTSLNTDELKQVERFSILVTHPEHGSLVQEVQPPNR